MLKLDKFARDIFCELNNPVSLLAINPRPRVPTLEGVNPQRRALNIWKTFEHLIGSKSPQMGSTRVASLL
jgi:hypothetical protein